MPQGQGHAMCGRMVTSFTSGKARLRPLLRPAYESVPKSAVDRRTDTDQCLLLRGRDLAGRLAAPATAADDGGRRTPRRTGHEDAGPAGRIFHGHADWAECRRHPGRRGGRRGIDPLSGRAADALAARQPCADRGLPALVRQRHLPVHPVRRPAAQAPEHGRARGPGHPRAAPHALVHGRAQAPGLVLQPSGRRRRQAVRPAHGAR